MNVLMFSIDDRLFLPESEVRERIRHYGRLFDFLWIVVFTRRDREPQSMGPNIFLYPVAAGLNPLNFFKAYFLGSRILKKAGPHTVITSQDAFSNTVAFFLKWRYRLTLQVQIHTDFLAPSFRWESLKNLLRYLIYRWSAKRADCIRVVSERIRRSLISHFPFLISRIVVLSIFVDVQKIAAAVPAFDLRERHRGFHPIILMVGRLTREKNFGLALEIISELAEEFPKLLLVIVGEGPERDKLKVKSQPRRPKGSGLRPEASGKLKVADYVRFEGWQQDLIPYYKGADVLLVTSRYEGYGRMLVEAAAAGLPIVTTEVGIVGETFRPEESVLVFSFREGGVSALKRIITDHDLRSRLRENARQAVSEVGDLQKYLGAYRAALAGCRKQ